MQDLVRFDIHVLLLIYCVVNNPTTTRWCGTKPMINILGSVVLLKLFPCFPCAILYPFEAEINFKEISKSTCSVKWYITSIY